MIDIDASELGKIKLILTSIGVTSKEAMIEQSSKAGNKTRLAVRRRFAQSTTEWTQQYIKGKRVLLKNKIAGNGYTMNKTNFKLGRRISHKDGTLLNPPSMENFITSFTMESTGTTVVGGVHKGFNPPLIKDGKIVGRGTRVTGVSRETIAILEKLNYGKRDKYGAYLNWQGRKRSFFDESSWKKREFFEKGWSDVKGSVLQDMTSSLEKIIGNRANNDIKRDRRYAI